MDQSERQGNFPTPITYSVRLLTQNSTDQGVVARLAEVDMIVADLERANGRVAAVERRNVR